MKGASGLIGFIMVFIALMAFGGAIKDPVTVKTAAGGAALCLVFLLALVVVNLRSRQ